MIRVCILTLAHSDGTVGGAEFQIGRLIDALLRDGGFEVRVIATLVKLQAPPAGYEVVQIGARNPTPRLGYLVHARELLRALEDYRPDVIYQRVACAYTGIAAYYARHHASRLVWHVAHDSDVEPDLKMLGRNWVRARIERSCIEYGLRRADRIVVQARRQAELLREHYAIGTTTLIPNFHPTPPLPVAKRSVTTVVWVANLKPWKRPEVFIALAQALKDVEGVEFVMIGSLPAGSGDRAWRDEVTRMISETPNLSYRGAVAQETVNALLEESHLFVNTSLQEGFPNTFIQAWMREVPVVSLTVDPDGSLGRGETGALAGSEMQLHAAVRALLADPSRRAGLGRRAREHAVAEYSLANADRLVALLRQSSDAGASTCT